MNKDKKVLYTMATLTFAVLAVILFLTSEESKIVTAIAMALITPTVWLLIKKRTSLSINKKEVLLLTTVIAALYVIFVLIAGMFITAYKNPYFVDLKTFFSLVLPTAVIIFTSEVIRYVFLSQKNTFASVISWIICLLAEVLIFSGIADFDNFNYFMDFMGMTLFPAISANVYYHYTSKRYGMFPNLLFRFIYTLYVYFIPVYTEIPNALHSCIKILMPFLMLALVKALFEKKKKNAVEKGRKLSMIGMVLAAAVVISTAMLISCQFKYGALVIATESMTGEINKGDMIIYEKYEDQSIKEGQVIVFKQQDKKIVHRVVEIEHIGGEVRYITKGDANDGVDLGYITDKDIVGLTDMKVAYIGYPTLWLRELLPSSN